MKLNDVMQWCKFVYLLTSICFISCSNKSTELDDNDQFQMLDQLKLGNEIKYIAFIGDSSGNIEYTGDTLLLNVDSIINDKIHITEKFSLHSEPVLVNPDTGSLVIQNDATQMTIEKKVDQLSQLFFHFASHHGPLELIFNADTTYHFEGWILKPYPNHNFIGLGKIDSLIINGTAFYDLFVYANHLPHFLDGNGMYIFYNENGVLRVVDNPAVPRKSQARGYDLLLDE